MSLFSYFQRFTAMASTFISDPTFCYFPFPFFLLNRKCLMDGREPTASSRAVERRFQLCCGNLLCFLSIATIFPFFFLFVFCLRLSLSALQVVLFFFRSESRKNTIAPERIHRIHSVDASFIFLNYFNRAVCVVEHTKIVGQLDVICYLFG